MSWRPTASFATLAARAALNSRIRSFFAARGVLEVETPLLCRHSGTDPHLAPITANFQSHLRSELQTFYLQTSPEFAMKRLLANGSGAIYQLGKAFRNGERGSRHNPEFTMLEWYRPGFTLHQLMDEVEALVCETLQLPLSLGMRRISYRQLFSECLGIDPHTCPLAKLQSLVLAATSINESTLTSRSVCLDLLYSHVIEPQLNDAVFVHSYPSEQAALARTALDDQGESVALRFELVMRGMEIANGYDELVDADEQRRRFIGDQTMRQQLELPPIAADERLLAALKHGLPACAGVALGVDRLLMLQTGANTIDEVLTFPLERA